MPEDPRRQFSDQELIDAVGEHAPAGTSEVAEAVDASRQAVDPRLKQLAEQGEIQRKQIAKVQVWYRECE